MTTISEEESERPINISKFNFSCDDEDLTIPEPLPRKSITDQIADSGDKVLIILDDVIADVRGKGKAAVENKLQKMFFNRRHLCGAGGSASIIATSQTYNKIDSKLRKACSHLICFENRNKREVSSIFDEIILIPLKEYMDVMKYIYDKKHNFMYIDTTRNQDDMIYKNFNKLTIDSPNIIKF